MEEGRERDVIVLSKAPDIAGTRAEGSGQGN